jgi:hypothetical protein
MRLGKQVRAVDTKGAPGLPTAVVRNGGKLSLSELEQHLARAADMLRGR